MTGLTTSSSLQVSTTTTTSTPTSTTSSGGSSSFSTSFSPTSSFPSLMNFASKIRSVSTPMSFLASMRASAASSDKNQSNSNHHPHHDNDPEGISTPDALLMGVDHMLDQTGQTDADAKLFLRDMVADLLRESEALRKQLNEAQEKIHIMQEREQQRQSQAASHQQFVETFVKAMQGQYSHPLHCVISQEAEVQKFSQESLKEKAKDIASQLMDFSEQDEHTDDTSSCSSDSSSSSPTSSPRTPSSSFQTNPYSFVLTKSQKAADLTIQGLTKKIERLNEENQHLVDKIFVLTECVDDLTSELHAKSIKVQALETQFKTINKTRLKVVNRLMDPRQDRASHASNNNSPSCSSNSSVSSFSVRDDDITSIERQSRRDILAKSKSSRR